MFYNRHAHLQTQLHKHRRAHPQKNTLAAGLMYSAQYFWPALSALPLPALTARIDFHIRISVRRRRHLFFRLQTANGNINVNVERQQRRRRCRSRSLLNLNYAHQSESNGTVAFASSFNAAVNVGSAVRSRDASAILCASECALSR